MCSAHESYLALWEAFAHCRCYMRSNKEENSGTLWITTMELLTMAPNLALLAVTPNLTGLSAAAAGKSSRLHWFYDFIVTQQTRHTASEVAR
jgi:hypothetical protein